jgi:hypothetical protein
VHLAAERESDLLVDDIRRRMAGVAHDLVIAPAEGELLELERFRVELDVAAGLARPL